MFVAPPSPPDDGGGGAFHSHCTNKLSPMYETAEPAFQDRESVSSLTTRVSAGARRQ